MENKEILIAIETKFNELKESSKNQYLENIEKFELELKEINEESLKKEDLEDIEKSFENLSKEVQKLSETGKSNKAETIESLLKEKSKEFESFKNKETGIFKMTVKADTIRGSVASNPQGDLLPNIGQLPEPSFDLSNFFASMQIGANSNGVVRYIDWDEATSVRAAAMVAEGGVFPESTAKWVGHTLPLEKIGDSIPVSEEMLEDVVWAQSEISNFLLNNVKRVENTQLYSGSGVSPNISGIKTLAPVFDTVAYALSSKAKAPAPADIMDLIKILKKEIEKSQSGKYAVNVVFMSPEEYTATVLKKDTTGRRLREQLIEMGITIIPTSFVTDNELSIGDGRFAKVYNTGDYEIEIDRNGTDFVDGMMTLRAKKRMALLLRQADRSGFLSVTDVAAALVAVTV